MALLIPKKAPWPSREQWLRDASEFSHRLRGRPLQERNFGLISFFLIVALPTIAVVIYFAFLASDQYFAEVRFAVRNVRDRSLASDIGSPKIAGDAGNLVVQRDRQKTTGEVDDRSGAGPTEKSTGGLPGALSSLTRSTDDRQVSIDAYALSSFIQSRNMVEQLDKDNELRAIYSRREADWFARFNPLASNEALLKYWRGKVTPNVDSISGIVTVRVLAFRRDDALSIATGVIRIGSQMVNEYSQAIRDEAVKNASKTVEDAARRYQYALYALREFRDIDRAVDPINATGEKLKALVVLETERARVEREKRISEQLISPEAIVSQMLADRLASLNQQIEKLRTELTQQSDMARTASVAIGQYRDLELTRNFAERSFAMEQAGYERARFEAEYKGIALAVFLPPREPEIAGFPRRMVNILLMFGASLVVWALVRLAGAGAIEYFMLRR